jgi:hypothetical protein
MWETDRQGDLVADDRAEVGIAYADGAPLQSVVVQGSVTDAIHYLRLVGAVPHHGRPGAGVVLDGQSIDCFGIEVHDSYTVIDDLELVRFNPDSNCGPAGVFVWGSNVLVRRLLVHDFKTTNLNASSAIRLTNATFASARVENMMAYGGRVGARIPANTVGELDVMSSSFFDMLQNGVENNGTVGSMMTVTNTIALGSGTTDFVLSGTGTLVQANNASSDGTAAGAGSLTNVSPAATYVSTTPGAEDLHLQAGSLPVDRGQPLGFADDIDGDPRPTTGWDIGADELP